MIKTFNRENLKDVMADAVSALREVAAKHDLELQGGRSTFDDITFNYKVKFVVRDQQAKTEQARKDFGQLAALYDLAPTDFGRKFTYSGEVYEIAGIGNSRKRPIKAKNLNNGKTYNFTQKAVEEGIRA
jgi:hypothetical protein